MILTIDQLRHLGAEARTLRRAAILELYLSNLPVSTAAIVLQFKVSRATAKRDAAAVRRLIARNAVTP